MSGRLAQFVLSRRALWPVLVAGLLRLVAAVAVEAKLEAEGREFLIAGDAAGYLDLAEDLARGRMYAVNDGPFARAAMRVPLFPLTLAGPVRLELATGEWARPGPDRHTYCRIVVVLCGVLAVWATGRLGDAVGGPRVGEAAAWLAALNPLAIAFSTMLLSESLFCALITLSLAGVAECVRRDPLTGERPTTLRWGPAIWAGLATAGACLTRPVWLPFLPCVVLLAGLWAWRAGGLRQASWTLPFGAAFLIGFAPWPLRNQAVLGHPVMTTTWGGPTLYDSLGPQADGSSDMQFRDRQDEPEGDGGPGWDQFDQGAVPPEMGRSFEMLFNLDERGEPDEQSDSRPSLMFARYRQTYGRPRWLTHDPEVRAALEGNELASDRLYRSAASAAARRDPLRVARLAIVKQGRFWRPWPVAGLPGGAVGVAMQVGFAGYFLTLAGLAVWGGWRLWRSGGGEVDSLWALVLTWGPILGFAAVCLVFVGSVRYRLPGEFPLCVAAAVGGLDLWNRRRRRAEA